MMKQILFSQIKVGENYSRESVGDVSSLVESIKEHGLQQPMVVDSEDNLVAGFRRYAALERLGYMGTTDDGGYSREVWVGVTDSPNPPVVNLIENLERENLTFYEEALAVKKLFPNHTEQEVADAVGMTRGWSRPRIKMWELPQEIIDKIKSGDLTPKKVAQIVNSKNSKELCDKIIGGEELPEVSSRPGKKELQSAITTCLERGHLDLAQAFRYVLGDINEEEFWDSVGRD